MLSGHSNHMLEIHNNATNGDTQCQLTIEHLAYKIASQIAAYSVILQGIDAIIFTGGMGKKAYYLRTKVANHLKHFGLKLNQSQNRKNSYFIQSKDSQIIAAVIPTNEELQIAKETKSLLQKKS